MGRKGNHMEIKNRPPAEDLLLLEKQIRPIPQEMLSGLPAGQVEIFSGYKIFPIDLLVFADWNYKGEFTDEDTNQLGNLMDRIGQVENIQVRKIKPGTYEVINGNHRLKEMRRRKYEFVIAYDHGDITLEEAHRIAIETNETKFKADDLALGKLMKGLIQTYDRDALLETMPYKSSDLDALVKLTEFDWSQFDGKRKGDNKEGGDEPKIYTELVQVYVSKETARLWEEQKRRIIELSGSPVEDGRIFEFALIELSNLPDESIS